MRKSGDKIQDAELEVMQVLWQAGQPMALAELRRILAGKCGWEDSTVKTLLHRLCEKGAVCLERRGVYRAVLTQEAYRCGSTRRFIGKVFAGSAKTLVASLLADGQLSQADIEELSALFHGEGST